MLQELKVRITNISELEEKLTSLGANFVEEIEFTDTYFDSPQGEVLKITEATDGNFLVELKSNDGKFDETRNDKLENIELVKQQLVRQYGIKRILKGKRKRFVLNNKNITLNHIEDVGDFLVLYTENPEKEFITQTLGVKDPEYITVPFSEL